MKTRASGVLIALFFLFPISEFLEAQEHGSTPTQSKYSQVIDRVFQFSRGLPAEFQGVQYRVVIRFLPSFDAPESQIVLVKRDDGTVRVTQYRLKQGIPPISEKCNEILEKNPEATVSDILKQVPVEKVERAADEATVVLFDRLFELSIPTKFVTDRVILDGTRYELWIQTPQNKIHAVLTDGAYGDDKNAAPIMHWIKELQVRIENRN